MQNAWALVAAVIVIAAAYYATYWFASKSTRRIGGSYIRILDRFALTREKLLCVVEFNKTIYLIAITDGAVETLERLDASELRAGAAEQAPNFVDALKHAWSNRKGGAS